MAKKSSKNTGKIQNRRARYDYDISDELIAGIVLSGKETKSLRLKHGHLRGAYVNIRGEEAWLTNATITSSPGIFIDESESTKERKLLLKKRELEGLIEAKKQGRTIVPLEILTKGRYIKIKIAIGKGKKRYDKRQTIKKRDQERANRLELKDRNR